MARKGDIDSKPVSSRVPMEVFIRLQTIAYQKKKTMSAFLCDVLSDKNFGQGGQTKIEYRDRLVPKIEYRDRIIEKEVPVEYHNEKIIDNPKLIEENNELKNRIVELEKEIIELKKPKRYNASSSCDKEEDCHPDYEWMWQEDLKTFINMGKLDRNNKKL